LFPRTRNIRTKWGGRRVIGETNLQRRSQAFHCTTKCDTEGGDVESREQEEKVEREGRKEREKDRGGVRRSQAQATSLIFFKVKK